jgi:hypothetical protein
LSFTKWISVMKVHSAKCLNPPRNSFPVFTLLDSRYFITTLCTVCCIVTLVTHHHYTIIRLGCRREYASSTLVL